MPIQRRTTTTIEEIVDSPIGTQPTSLPAIISRQSFGDADTQGATKAPIASEISETYAADKTAFKPITAPQRTNADLVAEFIHNPRAISTLLTIISVLLFAAKLETITDFWRPLVTTAILNGVWFFAPAKNWVCSYFRKSID